MPTRLTDRMRNVLGVLGIIVLLTFGFVLLFFGAVPEALADIQNAPLWLPRLLAIFTSLPFGFFVAMLVAFFAAMVTLAQFIQGVWHLEPEEAWRMMWRIFAGVYRTPPFEPVMRVQEGRPDPDGPEVLHDVGGPGYLTVGHDNAVVLALGSVFTRVEGATLVRLEPGESIWETVDLRPQRREVLVSANTRDGIPVTCKAELRFRVRREQEDSPHDSPTAPPLTFSDKDRETVLRLATQKVALEPGSERSITDWTIYLINGTFMGEVRDCIERYKLDELFDTERNGPALLTLLGKELEDTMRSIGKKRGVQIDQVHLVSILPDASLIPEQWLALWRSGWHRNAVIDEAKAKAMREGAIEKARAGARAEMIAALVSPLGKLEKLDSDSLLLGVRLEFLRMMRVLSQMDPLVQSSMFQQVENLDRVINQALKVSAPEAGTPPLASPTEKP